MNKIVYNIWPNLYYYISVNKLLFVLFHILVTTLLAIGIFLLYKFIRTSIQFFNERNKVRTFINNLKQYYRNQLRKKTGIGLIKGFLNYLETYIVESKYRNLDELLSNMGFNDFEINKIKLTLYRDEQDTQEAELMIKKMMEII